MKNRKDRIVRFAKQNSWFRRVLVGIYKALPVMHTIWRKSLPVRKELTACMTVFALCVSRIFMMTAGAVETLDTVADSAEVGGRTDTSGHSSETENSSGDGQTTGEESGTDESDKDSSAGNGEKIGSDTVSSSEESEGQKEGENDNEENSSNSPVSSEGEQSADGKESSTDNMVGDMSGNDVTGNDFGIDDTAKDSDTTADDAENNSDVITDDDAEVDDSVSGNDLTEEMLPEEEPVYQYVPQLSVSYQMMNERTGLLVGNASSVITLSTVSSPVMPEEGEETVITPAAGVYWDLDGETIYTDLSAGSADITLPDGFYGRITFTAEDEAGNTSEEITPVLFIDAAAPVAELTENELSDGSKQITAVFKESGVTATGIEKVSCFIDDAEMSTDGYAVSGVTENCYGQGVVSEAELPLEIDRAGMHTVRIEVNDYAGNISSYTWEVEMPEKAGPISVSVPSKVALTIEPWADEEQIYSDVFTIENKSGYDIIATLDNVELTVNRDNVGGDVSRKDCGIYLSGGVAEDICLPEGNSGELFSVRIPAKEEDGETDGRLTLRVYGKVSDGSEKLWKDGDVNLKLSFDYRVAEKKL